MLGALTGLQTRKQYVRVSFTNATAYVHNTHVHYRFRGVSQVDRDRRAVEFAATYGGYTKELPGKPGLVVRIDGDLRAGEPNP